MLVSRHRIGEYLPEVVHQGPDPAAVAVCREVLAESGAECVIQHGSRGWGGWDEQSDLNVIVIHHGAGDEVERDRLRGEVVRVKERRYRDSSAYKADLESGPDIVTPEDYAAQRRTLNHTMARAARAGTIFPKEPGAEGRYRRDGDTSNEWELVTAERLRMATSRNRGIEDHFSRDGLWWISPWPTWALAKTLARLRSTVRRSLKLVRCAWNEAITFRE